MTDSKNKNSFSQLPDGFKNIYTLNLQKDKKIAVIVNVISLLIFVAFAVAGAYFAYVNNMILFSVDSLASMLLKLGVMLGGTIIYLVLHEAVHGAVMKYYGAKKIKYGYTGLYAFAGCDGYFKRKPYIVIALAPIVLWGIILAVVCVFVPRDWFWVVYFIQLANLSGAAGDIYVSYKFLRLPNDILIRDTGIEMTVYSAVSC